MRLLLTGPALTDLDEILKYVSERSPNAAERIDARMRSAFALIARYPNAAQSLLMRPDVRRFPLARYPYVIYYRIEPEGAGSTAYPSRRAPPPLGPDAAGV